MPTTTAATPSNLPPLAADGVFAASASVIIDAPREKVWSVILDFPSYVEWNPFARNQFLVDESYHNPLEDQTPAEGKYFRISPVHVPPTMGEPTSFFQKQSTLAYISSIDRENYRITWCGVQFPKSLLHTERWQGLSEVQEGDDSGKTMYETIEVFKGPLAYLIRFLFMGDLKKGFQAMADALKERSESIG